MFEFGFRSWSWFSWCGGDSALQTGDLGQHLAQARILAAQDVALADPAALHRGEVARSDVVDVDHVPQVVAAADELMKELDG